MLLKIDFNENDVVYKGKGRIILKVNYYSQFATGPHFNTVNGYTKEDFDANPALKGKTMFIGQKGGISIES